MTVTDITDARLVTGTEEPRRQARDELRRHITIKKAMLRVAGARARRPRVRAVRDRRAHPHTRAYRVRRGESDNPPCSGANAFYIALDGLPRYLEHPPGPRTREELDFAKSLRDAGFTDTAATLEKAWVSKQPDVALTIPDRVAILTVLDDAPEGLAALAPCSSPSTSAVNGTGSPSTSAERPSRSDKPYWPNGSRWPTSTCVASGSGWRGLLSA